MKSIHRMLYCVVAVIAGSVLSYSQLGLHLIATMQGDSMGDEFGVVTYVGDINGDGYDDVIVGAPHGNYAKLFFGGAVLDTLPDMILHCEQVSSRFGFAIAGGQDINGDGYTDFVISAPFYWYGGQPFGVSESGKIYVYFGGPNIDSVADLEITMDGWYYNFGCSIALGDINGDGYADIIVGAYNDDIDQRGRVYIYFGGGEIHTSPDVVLEGQPWDMFGSSVAFAGDVNGDGYGDLLIGAPQHSFLTQPRYGKAYLLYGGQSISLSNSDLFVGDSVSPGQFGRMVAGLGDLNGDGFKDFGIMSLNKINLYFGNTKIDTAPSVVFFPSRDFGFIGPLHDVNADGFDDFVLVSDSARIYFGAASVNDSPAITLPWATPVCRLGTIDAAKLVDIACTIGGGWDPKGRVNIYSFKVSDGVGKKEGPTPPRDSQLYQNYSNPFNPNTTIQYQLKIPSQVRLVVYNFLGQKIATLVNEQENAGSHSVEWNASNAPSGVYFYQTEAVSVSDPNKRYVDVKKMILLK